MYNDKGWIEISVCVWIVNMISDEYPGLNVTSEYVLEQDTAHTREWD